MAPLNQDQQDTCYGTTKLRPAGSIKPTLDLKDLVVKIKSLNILIFALEF